MTAGPLLAAASAATVGAVSALVAAAGARRPGPRPDPRPGLRIPAAVLLALAALWLATPWPLAAAVAVLALPMLLARQASARRRRLLAEQLDGTITALAGSLGATPNFGDALASIVDFQPSPMQEELRRVLAEVRLGRTLDEALLELASRTALPGLDAMVAAAITGRRTGGDLPEILRRTAASLREIDRLEGVVRSKTAEGRGQAVVMGLVPPVLIAALDWIDPHWLEPLWADPIGWAILGAAAITEIAAIAMIRRIMAVDL